MVAHGSLVEKRYRSLRKRNVGWQHVSGTTSSFWGKELLKLSKALAKGAICQDFCQAEGGEYARLASKKNGATRFPYFIANPASCTARYL